MIDVERSPEAPASLSEGRSYKGADVLAALHHVFLRKCYLCETPVDIGKFDVDHRRPKGEERFAHLTFA